MNRIFLLLLGAALFSLPWLEVTSLTLLGAFVPLLWIQYRTGGKGVMPYAFFTFLLWNAVTTYWVGYAVAWGAAVAMLANTGLNFIVFWIYNRVWRRAGRALAYTVLVTGWVACEHFYLNAEISWPWLTLGFGFAHDIKLVQWYEYLGSLGGSLWALLCNLTLFTALKRTVEVRRERRIRPGEGRLWTAWTAPAFFFLVPTAVSLWMYYNYEERRDPVRIAVVQPNIDPYNEKFGGLTPRQQEDIILELAAGAPEGVDYFLAPETALDDAFWVEGLTDHRAIARIRNFLRLAQPQAGFIIGLTTFEERPGRPGRDPKPTPTARISPDGSRYYDIHNSAVQIDTSRLAPLYHKSMLVVGAEKLPYPEYLDFLGDLSIRLGGISGSLSGQPERTLFTPPGEKYRVGTAICYESVYGEFFTGYVRKGAQAMFIITNDGWWKDSPGYKQHFSYARLRAVETRRSVARSANTGISGFIDQRGRVIASLGWDRRGLLADELNLNDRITFYVKYGDVVGRVAGYTFLLCLLYYVAFRRRTKDHLYMK